MTRCQAGCRQDILYQPPHQAISSHQLQNKPCNTFHTLIDTTPSQLAPKSQFIPTHTGLSPNPHPTPPTPSHRTPLEDKRSVKSDKPKEKDKPKVKAPVLCAAHCCGLGRVGALEGMDRDGGQCVRIRVGFMTVPWVGCAGWM